MADDLALPSSIPVKALEHKHEDCHEKLEQKYQDFYEGGHRFEQRKGNYLRPRQIESAPGGDGYRKARLNASYYTPHLSGIIDSIVGTMLSSPPRIEVDGSDERSNYWCGLNKNADGYGRDLRSLALQWAVGIAVHGRSYISINTPSAALAANLRDQKRQGGIDPRLCVLSAKDVDDWEYDDQGELLWARTHYVEYVRSVPYGERDIERHTWGFHTAKEIVEFQASRKKGETSWPGDAVARQISNSPHGLGAVPIIPIEVPQGFWIVDRLFSTVLAFFNRESSRAFCLDTGALNLPVLKYDGQPSSVTLSELGCLSVGINGDFYFRSPDGTVYQALKDDCDYLLGNCYSAIHAMALRASSQQENARQSGTAKVQDKAPMESLLGLFAAPTIDALEKAVTLIARMRQEEDLKPKVCGMDSFDIQSMELEINKTANFVNVPGMLPSAKQYAVTKLAKSFLEDAPDEIVKAMDKESKEKPVEENQESNGSTTIRNPRTLEASGYEASSTRSQIKV